MIEHEKVPILTADLKKGRHLDIVFYGRRLLAHAHSDCVCLFVIAKCGDSGYSSCLLYNLAEGLTNANSAACCSALLHLPKEALDRAHDAVAVAVHANF